MTPTLLIVYALAAARVTGLTVSDTLFESARDRILVHLPLLLAEGAQCYWCVGMWVAMVAAPLVWLFGESPFMLVPALALASSQVTGMIAGIGRGGE